MVGDDFWSVSAGVSPLVSELRGLTKVWKRFADFAFLIPVLYALIRSNFVGRARDSLLPETHFVSSSLTAEIERFLLDGQ